MGRWFVQDVERAHKCIRKGEQKQEIMKNNEDDQKVESIAYHFVSFQVHDTIKMSLLMQTQYLDLRVN